MKIRIMEVNRLPFSRLLKSEVAQLADRLLGIVETHNPELLQLEPVFNLLKAQKPQIDILNIRYGVDPNRLELIPLREHMVLQTSAIKLQLRMLSKKTNDQSLQVIQTSVDGYLRYLNASRNEEEIDSKIVGFLNEVKTDDELAIAIDEHDLSSLIVNLKEALEDVKRVKGRRVKLLSQRPETQTQELTKQIASTTELLFKDLEVSQLKNPDVDYTSLIREVNQLLDQFRNRINRREAYNKRKADEQHDNNMEGEMNGSENPTTENYNSTEMETQVASNGDLYHPSEVYETSIKKMNLLIPEHVDNGSDEMNLENIDNKKAVATTANHLQQPMSVKKV